MDDVTSETPPTSTTSTRRDFLRRASKQVAQEAVEIGAKVVPGGAILKRFVAPPAPASGGAIGEGESASVAPPLAGAGGATAAPTLLQSPLRWLAAWRERRK